MSTEWERKQQWFQHKWILATYPWGLFLWYEAKTHSANMHPMPAVFTGEAGSRSSDFRMYLEVSQLRNCQCSFLDIQCKKQCRDEFREKGLRVWGQYQPRKPQDAFYDPY